MAWQTLDQQYEQQNNRNDRSNYLQDIIAGLSIANNNDPATLAGYGIGRFLSNYVNRGLERRQQEKNQGAYDEWMRGRQGIKGKELLPELQGTPIVNPNTQPQKYSFDPSKIAAEINQQNASGGRPNYLERALEGSAFSAGGKPFFEMPQGNAQPQTESAPSMQEAARSIAAEIASRPTTPRFDMTSDEVYQQAYEIARRNGSTEDQARKFAQQRAGIYQSQRVQSLSDQFLNGGVNPDGTINNQGVATLAQLAQENPQQVNMLGNMYQTPQGATKYAQDIARLTTNSNLSLRNTLEAQRQLADLKERAAQAAFGRSVDMLNVQEQMELNQRMRLAEILVQGAGFSPQEAVLYAFGGGGGGSRSGGRNGSGRNGGNNNGTVGSSEAWKAYERATEKFNEAQAMLEPGQPNPMAALYQNALYNYFGNIDPSNPRNLAAWKEYFRVVEGMSGEDFDAWIKSRVRQQETADKNQRLEVNGSHNDDDDEPEEAEREPEENNSPGNTTEEAAPMFDASLDNSPVAIAHGLMDAYNANEEYEDLPEYAKEVLRKREQEDQERKQRIYEAYFGK